MRATSFGLSGNALKAIAILTMTIDHLAWALWPGYDTRWWVLCLHAVGRITAPIMWYMIAEGYHYTRDRKKYALRLLGFAFVSHFAYNFNAGIPLIPFSTGEIFNQTSVMWALFLGLLALMLFDVPQEKLSNPLKYLLLIGICVGFSGGLELHSRSCCLLYCILSRRFCKTNGCYDAVRCLLCGGLLYFFRCRIRAFAVMRGAVRSVFGHV